MKKLLILLLFPLMAISQNMRINDDILNALIAEDTKHIPFGNLIGYFEFEDNANNLVGDKEVFTTSSPTYSSGWIKKSFDGATTSFKATAPDNDLFSFANAGNDEPFSVSFWINTSDYGGFTDGDILIGKMNNWSSSSEWAVYQFGEGLGIVCTNPDSSGYIYSYVENIPLNQWVFITFTYDGSNLETGFKAYINSELETPYNEILNYTGMVKQTVPASIGACNDGSNRFKRKVDGLSIWDKVLTQTEITAIYNWQRSRYVFKSIVENMTIEPEEVYAFPTAYGAGAEATGGRGGQVIHVTTLNWSGTGSLKAALQTSGARTIVFDVSGEIIVTDNYFELFGNGDLTIAGQTAPEGGITIRTRYFNFDGVNNVIIRHVRFRGTDNVAGTDATWFSKSSNLIFDHCTFSHGFDEALDVSYSNGTSQNVTIQNCFFQDSKTGSILGIDSRGETIPTDDLGNFTFTRNLISNISHRFPNTQGNGRYDIINNVVYNWKERLIRTVQSGQLNVLNNYYKPSAEGLRRSGWYPGTNPMTTRLHKAQLQIGDELLVHTAGNIVTGSRETPQSDDRNMWTMFVGSNTSIAPIDSQVPNTYFTSTQFPLVGKSYDVMTALETYEYVLENAGAWAYLNADGTYGVYRDSKDTADLLMIENDTFESYESNDFTYTPWNLVPYPTLPNNSRPNDYYVSNPHIPQTWFAANVPSGQDHNDIAPSGYTWLEEYLNGVDVEDNLLSYASPEFLNQNYQEAYCYVTNMLGQLIYEGVFNEFEPQPHKIYAVSFKDELKPKKLIKL